MRYGEHQSEWDRMQGSPENMGVGRSGKISVEENSNFILGRNVKRSCQEKLLKLEWASYITDGMEEVRSLLCASKLQKQIAGIA